MKLKTEQKLKKLTRLSLRIRGIVQGVGFRPFIYSLAKRHFLTGFVLNDTSGVKIEVEGEVKKTKDFLDKIKLEAPPLAIIEEIDYEELLPKGYPTFEIKRSKKEKEKFIPLSPDISICADCLRELFDKDDKRYHYPFINCTNCGPRFTIIEDIPYDRAHTTMKEFKLCPKCQSEYEDPSDRRFHAQPNACPVCGPRVSLFDNKARKIQTDKPIKKAVYLLKKGFIVAVKGLGGFHLACDAANKKAVTTLRKRKYREDKPFALMAMDIKEIREFCQVSDSEEKLLLSPRRPILLLRKRKDCSLPDGIAPQNKYLGMFLPYTPLHYLLLNETGLTLVMTSGNISDEPIVYKNKEAFKRLEKIADYFLISDRKIQIRTDDSVSRVFKEKEMLIRRSRGYAPQPIRVRTFFDEPILAVGGELKNTFCLARENYAFLSHHIGDLENLSALTSFEEGIEHYSKIFHISPKIVASDLHPDYLSTQFARKYCRSSSFSPELIFVQHHHAHIASCLIDNGIEPSGSFNQEVPRHDSFLLPNPLPQREKIKMRGHERKVIGVAFDGAGLGDDGAIWGGEFLVTDLANFMRAASFKYLPLPGGEKAVKEPWRMAISYLNEVYGDDFQSLDLPFLKSIDKDKLYILLKIIKRRINCPLTSSVGRLFDAVSALTEVRSKINYEAQAARELEMLASEEEEGSYPFSISEENTKENGLFIIDTGPIIKSIVNDLLGKEKREKIAARFHNTMAEVIEQTCSRLRERFGLNEVALSGGVFQNIFLLKRTLRRLNSSGFYVYTHKRVPPNDGGISLGQAVIAHYRSKERL